MSDAEIVKDFLVESYENLDRLDRDLVELEKNPQDRDALAGVFRTIHTIKGTCGFLGYGKLEKVAHVGENLLTPAAGWAARAQSGDYDRAAGHGGCGAPDAEGNRHYRQRWRH